MTTSTKVERDHSAAARTLRLTLRQTRFCEALVRDPNSSGSAAARQAGYAPAAAHVTASRLLRLPKVQTHLSLLSRAARKHAEAASGESIASAAEVLIALTRVLRAGGGRVGDYFRLARTPSGAETLVLNPQAVKDAPVGTIRRISKDQTGGFRVEFADALAAGRLLLAHHARERGPEDPMRRPRAAASALLFRGTPEDRERLDELARRASELAGQNATKP